MTELWNKVRRFVERDLWERDLNELSRVQRPLVVLVRLGGIVVDGFTRHQLPIRACALTYITVFSLVPTLAVAFAMFSAFGALDNAKATLLPKIMEYLAVGVRDQVDARLDEILHNVHAGAIGATGLVFVVVSVVSLLSSLEDVFNDIWGARRRRSYFERVTMYWTVVTVTPMLLVFGMSLPAIIGRLLPLRWMLEQTGTVDVFFSLVLPWIFVCVAFALMYEFMTATRIPATAAAIGGVAGGTLWFTAAHGYAAYAKASVYYANVYGSLSAIPIFLFWLYLSWLLVFLGAQVAFASHNLGTVREELLAAKASLAAREVIALRVMTEASRRFLQGATPPALEELPRDLQVSPRLVNDIANRLVQLDFLREVGSERRLVPARDPQHISPAQVLGRLREQGQRAGWRDDDRTTRALEALREQAETAAERAWNDLNFADLAVDRYDPHDRHAEESGSKLH